MSKNIIGTIKLKINGNGANQGKLGSAFGMKGVSAQTKNFCEEFNKQTVGRESETLQVLISIYEDKTISFVIKNETVSGMLLKALKVDKGSGKPNSSKKGSLPMSKVREIAEKKMPDLNTDNIDNAIKIILGSMKSLGIDAVEG